MWGWPPDGGVLLATGSGAGSYGTTYKSAPYAASKLAQQSIMESLYGQLRDAGGKVQVGFVLPPLTRTNLAGDDLSIWTHVEASLSKAKDGPRLAEPEDFAKVVWEGYEQRRFWVAITDQQDTEWFGGQQGGALRSLSER